MKRCKVGYFSAKNYLDRVSWSGTNYAMYHALRARRDLEVVGLGDPSPPTRRRRLRDRWEKYRRLRSRPGGASDMRRGRAFAARVTRQLKREPCDVLFAPAAAWELAFLVDTGTPIVYLSDTTSRLHEQHYRAFARTEAAREYEVVHRREAAAIAAANKLVYPSQWAADSALSDFQAPPEKVEVVPFGANLRTIPDVDAVLPMPTARDRSICRLLFVAREWQRKGGDRALATAEALRAAGVATTLTVIGCPLPEGTPRSGLDHRPFLDCNRLKDSHRLSDLYLASHFLLLPSRADCSPIVISEASAHGLPVVTTNIGGIPTILRDGINGFMLSADVEAEAFAAVIAQAYRDPDHYATLVATSRQEYERRLNWSQWSDRVAGILDAAASAS